MLLESGSTEPVFGSNMNQEMILQNSGENMTELQQFTKKPLTLFEKCFIEQYPDDAKRGIVTRKQITKLHHKFGVPIPTKIVNNDDNKIARGVFKFSAGIDLVQDKSLNTEQSEPILRHIEPEAKETDADIDARIRKTYENMRLLVTSVADNNIRSLIISGHAGVGKSYEVKQTLEAHGISDYIFITGYLKNTGLFKLLYENRFENQIIVLDDSDKILTEMDSLNMLKNALELKKSRNISWLSEKKFYTEDGEEVPKTFEYQGSMIFLTNMDFQAQITKDTVLSPHLSAIDSRSIYLDLQIKTNKDILVRINQVMKESNILTSKGLFNDEQAMLMQYLTDNINNLKDLSLRTIEKLASLYLSSDKWQQLADATMLKKIKY